MKQVTLLFLFIITSLSAFAGDRFYKPTEKITFTYEEFRKLSPGHQEEWIKELRNFNRNVDLVLDGQRLTAKKPKFWSFFENIQIQPMNAGLCVVARSLASDAFAQSAANCTMKKQTNNGKEEICITCPGDAFTQVNQCTANDGNPNNVAMSLLAKSNQSNRGGKLIMDPNLLTTMAKVAMENRKVVAEAKVQGVEPSAARKAATNPDLTPLPEKDAKALLDLAKKQKDDEISKTWGQSAAKDTEALIRKEEILNKIDEQQAKKAKENFQPASGKIKKPKGPRSLDDTGSDKGNDNLDVDEVTSTDRLACIYAGWAIKADKKCAPISEKEIFDADGKRVVYSCKKNPAAEVEGVKVVAGDNSSESSDGNSTVLCNPVVFGLISGKPICIPRAHNATEECAKKSPFATESLALAKANPKEYRELTRRVSSLCQTDESKLKTHFEKRGKSASQVESAIKDLSTTCSHLRGRMAELEKANGSSAPDAGAR